MDLCIQHNAPLHAKVFAVLRSVGETVLLLATSTQPQVVSKSGVSWHIHPD
jgi:hypothetical protein